jgi:hypothetical protein
MREQVVRMRVVIGYESMYGNTHHVADAIAAGFDPSDDVTVAPVSAIDASVAGAEVLILGVPTHAHGLPRPSSRRAAIDGAHTKYDDRSVDPSAADTGAREWLVNETSPLTAQVAAFDTRFRPPAWLVGHPARGISRALVRRGGRPIASPESFYVDKQEQLRSGELDRARQWGKHLRRLASAKTAHQAL